MSKFKITNIQFFPSEITNQISETDYETIDTYHANIAINDMFIVQVSGNDNECHGYSIPTGNERSWKCSDLQDKAYEEVELSEIELFLKSEGVKPNYKWLQENASATY